MTRVGALNTDRTRCAGRRKQNGGVVIAGYDHDPIRAGARERGQIRDFGGMRLQDALETAEGFLLGAARTDVRASAIRHERLPELERVSVEDQVGRALARFIDGAQERWERVSPAKILQRVPFASARVFADAEMEVADDHGEPAGRHLLCNHSDVRASTDKDGDESREQQRSLTTELTEFAKKSFDAARPVVIVGR